MDGLGAMDLTAMVPSSPAPLPSPPPPKRPRHEVITTESDESDGPVEPVDHVDHVDPEANTGTAGKGKELCKDDIETIFPRICPDYVAGLSATHGNDVHAIIFAISEKLEVDGKYPVRPGPGHCQPRKRKRSSESSDSEDDLPNRRGTKPGPEDASGDPEYLKLVRSRTAGPDYAVMRQSREYIILALNLLCQDFKFVPRHDVQRQLIQNKGSVLETYIAMDEQLRNADRTPVPWTDMERPTEVIHRFAPGRLLQIDMGLYTQNERAALVEFAAARKLREDRKAQSEAAADEQQKLALARANGELVECGICFEECMVSRMVECQGDIKHRFCRSCMRSQAETEIGMSRHVLSCMSVDGCSAGFSVAQKELFLDEQLAVALDRIEAAENLRAAGIENLATCPFCPYAAEYPPVEVDKEFRCENPSCLQVSCRLCRRATHIPKSCAEDAAERGLNARHTLEEAMSEALIRRCNNCSYPFVKIDGCNKITCVKCRTKQCDVCRRTITHYNHFDDESRGGKRGRCPLYDRWDKRHAMEVNNAEKEARKKVLEEDPGVDKEILRMETVDEAKDGERERFPGPRPFVPRPRPFMHHARPFVPHPRLIVSPNPAPFPRPGGFAAAPPLALHNRNLGEANRAGPQGEVAAQINFKSPEMPELVRQAQGGVAAQIKFKFPEMPELVRQAHLQKVEAMRASQGVRLGLERKSPSLDMPKVAPPALLWPPRATGYPPMQGPRNVPWPPSRDDFVPYINPANLTKVPSPAGGARLPGGPGQTHETTKARISEYLAARQDLLNRRKMLFAPLRDNANPSPSL